MSNHSVLTVCLAIAFIVSIIYVGMLEEDIKIVEEVLSLCSSSHQMHHKGAILNETP